jgi:membrane protein DedA with SNARE-associated domain/rhodanese-related sulfurtransferase
MQEVTQIIEHYGIAVVFLSVLLDKAGLPIPSYPVLLVAGALSVSGGSPALAVLAAAIAGAAIADLLWYGAGVKFGRRALSLVCRVSLSPDSCVRQTETMFSRRGPWSLIYIKFVPGLRYVSVVLSGISRVSLPLFVVLDGVGNALYFAVALLLGWLFHDALDAVMATLVQLGAFGIALVIAGLALYLAIRWIERQNFIRQLKMDRISVDELVALCEDGHKPIIVDVRSAEARIRDGMIPGALASAMSDAPSTFKDLSRDAEIVIYCSCPNEATAAMAALHLKRAGFKRIRPLLGGIEAWKEAGQPIETVVLERDEAGSAAIAMLSAE